MIVKFVKYLIDKDVLDKQYEEDSIYGLTIMLEKIVAYVVLFCIAFIVRKPIDGMGQRKLGHDSHRYGRFIIIVDQREKSLYKAKRGCFISYTHLSTIRYMIQ